MPYSQCTSLLRSQHVRFGVTLLCMAGLCWPGATARVCAGDEVPTVKVKLLASPQEAARQAGKEQKLCFLLHISGNFEDSKFT